MPHTPEHKYTIYGTNQNYTGKVVDMGGELFTTQGGAYEGSSQKIVVVGSDSAELATTTQGDNPVTRTFVSRALYYREDGTVVPTGSNLHEHADATIMLGHDPENMGAIVTRTQPQTTQGNNQNVMQRVTRVRSNNREQARGTSSITAGGGTVGMGQGLPRAGSTTTRTMTDRTPGSQRSGRNTRRTGTRTRSGGRY